MHMDTVVFKSSSNPNVSIILHKDVREHLLRHFNIEMPGSKFYFDSPDSLLQTIVDDYPESIRKASFNEYGSKVASITFPNDIGNCNVVPLEDLTEDELSTLQIIQRGETKIRCVTSHRIIPTKDCQLILDENNNVITVYPGELAPPLPDTPYIHDRYWDNHAFLVFN